MLAVFWSALHQRFREARPWLVPALGALFFLFQSGAAYRHAMNYRSDLDFWDATRNAVPNSAQKRASTPRTSLSSATESIALFLGL